MGQALLDGQALLSQQQSILADYTYPMDDNSSHEIASRRIPKKPLIGNSHIRLHEKARSGHKTLSTRDLAAFSKHYNGVFAIIS